MTAIKTTGPAGRGKKRTAAKGGRSRDPGQHIANALRSAYEEAVQEDVPAEFLDLLGKLS